MRPSPGSCRTPDEIDRSDAPRFACPESCASPVRPALFLLRRLMEVPAASILYTYRTWLVLSPVSNESVSRTMISGLTLPPRYEALFRLRCLVALAISAQSSNGRYCLQSSSIGPARVLGAAASFFIQS